MKNREGNLRTGNLKSRVSTAAMIVVLGLTSVPAFAEIEVVVVTARKREESSLHAPVVVKVITAAEIERLGIKDFAGIAQQTPGLVVGEAASPVGGSIVLRGVSAGTANGSSDQAISINLDGLQVAKGGGALRVGLFDLQQIEILKGPQALFFGKNSPAGIISLRSADPTPDFFMSLRSGYEATANENFEDAVISGPITDDLGARLFIHHSGMDGFFENKAFGIPGAFVTDDRTPGQTEYFGRLSVNYNPSDTFSVRIKGSYYDLNNHGGYSAYTQRWNCEGGVAKGLGTVPGVDDCKADQFTANGNPGPAYAGLDSSFAPDGKSFLKNKLLTASVEANYNITDALTLTSITAFYRNDQRTFDNLSGAPIAFLVLGDRLLFRQTSEELRLSTHFDSPVNFLAGFYYDDSFNKDRLAVVLLPFGPGLLGGVVPTSSITGRTISAFGQATWNITDTIELAGGARWTQEQKKISVDLSGLPIPASGPQHFENVSPEVTLTWRPTDQLTVFGAYKQGYISGGYNTIATNIIFTGGVAGTTPYRSESARGGEIGVKAALFDNSVRLDAAVYDYKFSNIQLTTFDPSTGFSSEVTNAAASRIEGAELDAKWAPPQVDGLTLNGAVAYNRARYERFLGTCYVGQTAALGCNVSVPGATLQNLAGKPLERAPDWTANFGFTYDHSIDGGDLMLGLGADTSYSSSYSTFLQDAPTGVQPAYWLLNANMSLYRSDDAWNVSLIGRNLTNTFYVNVGFEDPFSFALPPGTRPDILGAVNRPREVIVQLTIHPADLFGK